jgi:hypothetical protein
MDLRALVGRNDTRQLLNFRLMAQRGFDETCCDKSWTGGLSCDALDQSDRIV